MAANHITQHAPNKRFRMFDTADSASFWFDIFNGVLLLGAFLVLAGTWGTIRAAAVKEKFSDQRTSALELETAQAKRDTASALERAALANQRAAEINAKYGARELSSAQIESLANKLRGAPLKVIVREEPSLEAHMYGYHFLEAFKRAGIETTREFADAAPPYVTGLHVIDPGGDRQARQFTPGMTALVDAFRELGLDFRTDWFWYGIPSVSGPMRPPVAPGQPPPKPADGFVLLYIGPKPIPRPDPTAPVIPR